MKCVVCLLLVSGAVGLSIRRAHDDGEAAAMRWEGTDEALGHQNSSVVSLTQSSFTRNTKGTIDICFVHVGKTGGESVMYGMKKLLHTGNDVSSIIQIHQKGIPEKVTWPYAKLKGSAMPGGEGSMDGRQHNPACAKTGNVIVWVRDPIARFLSCWKARIAPEMRGVDRGVQNGNFGDLSHVLKRHNLIRDRKQLKDIDSILVKLSEMEDGHRIFSEAMEEVPHARLGAQFYLDKCQDLDQLPIKFVGRTEAMDDDWNSFFHAVAPDSKHNITMPLRHNHDGKLMEMHLSAKSIAFLKEQPEMMEEMDCLKQLQKKGFLSSTYVDSLMQSDKIYKYHRLETDEEEEASSAQ